MADETKELTLLKNVENRIVFAQNDTALQTILKTFLCPILLKLESPHASVREKTISICQHVNTRVKPSGIQLPVAALLTQFQTAGAGPLLKNFDLMYIQRGLERVSIEELQPLLPSIVQSFGEISDSHARSMFQIFLSTLMQLPVPPSRGTPAALEYSKGLDLSNNQNAAKFLSQKLTDLLLLDLKPFQTGQPAPTPEPVTGLACPGLSSEQFEFLTGGKKETFTPSQLSNLKLRVIEFLNIAGFSDEDLYFPYLIAAGSELGSRLVAIGEDGLKKLNIDLDRQTIFDKSNPSEKVSYENTVGISVTKKLYNTYLGSSESRTPPVRAALKSRILSILSKSLLALNLEVVSAEEIRKLVEDGLLGENPEYNFKFRSSVFSFIVHLTRLAGDRLIKAIGYSLVESIRLWVYADGWPRSTTVNIGQATHQLRSQGYVTVGLLSRREPSFIVKNDLQVLRFLLSAVRSETRDMRSSAEDAISSLLPCLSLLTPSQREEVKEMTLESLLEDRDMAGWASYLKIANRALPFDDLTRIWICLMACATSSAGNSESSRDLADDGEKALHPYWFRVLHPHSESSKPTDVGDASNPEDAMEVDSGLPYNPYAIPKFEVLFEYLTSEKRQVARAFESYIQSSRPVQRVPLILLPHIVKFLRTVLLLNCVVNQGESEETGSIDLAVDGDWDDKITSALATSDSVRSLVSKYISQSTETSGYLELVLAGLIGTPNASVYGNILMELFPMIPWSTTQNLLVFARRNNWADLSRLVWQGKRSERELSSYLLGTFMALDDKSTRGEKQEWQALHMNRLRGWESTTTQDSNKAHGSILVLGYYLSRLGLNIPNIREASSSEVDSDVLSDAVSCYVNIVIDSRDSEFRDAAIVSLTQLCYFKVAKSEHITRVEDLLEKLKALGKLGHEKAIITLGALSLIYPTPEDDTDDTAKETQLIKIKEILINIHDSKMPELAFATGESLSVLVAGWDSQILARKMDIINGKIEGAGLAERKNGDLLRELVSELLEMRVKGGSASFRKAACVWLLSIVQYCGHLEEVRSRFEDIHTAFRLYLTDREEFVQETASRGLTRVYELGDKEMKEDLVRSLVSSFTGTTKTLAGRVQADTQLFEPGALPTGDGSISTYKDILSLASEVGDSSLVYKFMSLASHSAMWSSRAAFGRFGLGSIMSNSEDLLAENPKLYAKLFRYRFDPNPNVQRSMNEIWNALVKDPSSTIDKYFDEIMEDLLKTIIDREWRTREASCAAIADLVQGRQSVKYEKYVQKIWTMSFKVLDDIKASVREAAMKLCRTLTKSLIHTVSDENSLSPKEAAKTLDNIMPFLMGPNGLEAQAEDAQMLALKTLLDLVKKCGRVLRPYVPSMIEQFLNLLSSLEPQAMNYLHLNAAKYNLTEEKIDAARLSSVRASPMMDAIERCLDLADDTVMKDLIPRLTIAIKKAVGMPSKVGCSRIVVTLVIRHSFLFKPYADEILRVVTTALVDRNETVSASYAAAAGYLARLSTDESVIKLLQYTRRLYFEEQEERLRILSASVLNAISKHASDRFQALAAEILPFAFVAKHDTEEQVAEEYSKCWTENTGGSGAVKLYLPEITSLAGGYLESARWNVKQTAALSIADICVVLGPDLTNEQIKLVYPLAVKSVAGKSYPSKFKVLEGFAALCCSPKFSDETKLKEVSKILIREANRNNQDYRPHAFDSLAKYLKAHKNLNLYEEVFGLVEKVFDAGPTTDEDEMDTDSHGKASEKLWQITLKSSFQLLAACLHEKYPESASDVDRIVAAVEKQLLPSLTRDTKIAALELIEEILIHLQENGGVSNAGSPVDPKTWNAAILRLWKCLSLASKGASSENEKVSAKLKATSEKLCIIENLLQIGSVEGISELATARDQVNQFLGQT